jgi:hypothetical protein
LRELTVSLAVYVLVEAIVGRRQTVRVARLLALAVLSAEVVISTIVVALAEPAGAGLAFLLWLILLVVPERARAAMAGLALGASAIAMRLEPVGHGFIWVPFATWAPSLVAALTCFAKVLPLRWHDLSAGPFPRQPACGSADNRVGVRDWMVRRWLPHCSTEITGVVVAVFAAMLFALLPAETV